MRYLFFVQGEGRGHMTQAISLANLLRENGHEICHIIIGKSKYRELPHFFTDSFSEPISQVESPNFLNGKLNKSVNLWKSILHTMLRIGIYLRSIRTIKFIVDDTQPDIIINFYDFLGGIFSWLQRPQCKIICIGHQYMIKHSTFEFAPGSWFERQALQIGSWITSLQADTRLALSFRELSDELGIEVVPPLLRDRIKMLKKTDDKHILVYLLNHGYSKNIEKFHAENPEWKLHCFWDKKNAPNELIVDENLTFHRLNSELFLKLMAGCCAFVTTAGFESVCEAMYLGKPTMMIPVEGHYEQACNAIDGVNSGAGIKSGDFDLTKLINYIPNHPTNSQTFKNWANKASEIFLEKLSV